MPQLRILPNHTQLTLFVPIMQSQLIQAVSADVSSTSSIKPAIEQAIKLLGGGVDVLINNAGITHPERFDTVRRYSMMRCYGPRTQHNSFCASRGVNRGLIIMAILLFVTWLR